MNLQSEPEKVDAKLDEGQIQLLYNFLKITPLPEAPLGSFTPEPWKLGIEYDFLKESLTRFQTDWRYEDLHKKINAFPNYTVHWDDPEKGASGKLHFLHIRSNRNDAVPLLLLHGWPGTFLDFHKIIEPLTSPSHNEIAFHVVIPSLPGFCFSTLPQTKDWDIKDTAKLFNTLMTRTLGYKRYVGQGGDWGSHILRYIGAIYPEDVPFIHFNMFCIAHAPEFDLDKCSVNEKRIVSRMDDYMRSGKGYADLQNTKPLTIGLAVASSPVSLLSWIGEKFYCWSDPKFLDVQDLLDTVALYFLTDSFASSTLIYQQNVQAVNELVWDREKWPIRSTIGYTSFPYEINGAPKQDIPGSLVFYKERDRGGHFPALDNPQEFVEDLREFFGTQWPLIRNE